MPWQNDRAARQHSNATYGAQWKRQRKLALDRDGHRCTQCQSTRNLTVDHIVPVSRGGTHHLANLRTLCEKCHGKITAQQGGGYRARPQNDRIADPPARPTTVW